MLKMKREAWFRVQRFFALPPESYDHWTEIVKLEECKRDLLFIKECNRQESIKRTMESALLDPRVRHLVQDFLDAKSICQMDATCRRFLIRCETKEVNTKRAAICTIPPGWFGVSGDFAVLINATESDGVMATLYSTAQWTIVAVEKLPVEGALLQIDERCANKATATKNSVSWKYLTCAGPHLISVALTYCFQKREIAMEKCFVHTMKGVIVCPQRGTLLELEPTECGRKGFRLFEFDSSGKNLLQSSLLIFDDCYERQWKVLFLREAFIAVIRGEQVILFRRQGLALFSSFPNNQESRMWVRAKYKNWQTDGDSLYCWDSDHNLVNYDICGRKKCVWKIPASVGSVAETEEWGVRGNLFFTISRNSLLSNCRLVI
jgi:hypothetical protein